jgi:hypothetical protein
MRNFQNPGCSSPLAAPLDDDASVDDPPPQFLTTVGNDESRLNLRRAMR